MGSVAADATHLARALALAERGRATTAPNPMVGCVITNGGTPVAEGWHERPDGPHAEVAALAAAGAAAAGGTAYVTLEPCDHHGRTPPCSKALVDAGVRRVVYGMSDPNPVASGGAETLRAAGIEVSTHPLGAYVACQNRTFLTSLRTPRPDVTLKLAQTASGDLVTTAGRWITGEEARRHVHRLRARVDAVLVGIGTVLADDPRLDVRHVPVESRQPRPVVLDSRGRTPVGARVVRPGALVLTTASAPARWRDALTEAGVEVVEVPASQDGTLELVSALALLRQQGIFRVLAEPGATLAAALVRAASVDRVVVHTGGGHPERLAPCLTRPGDSRWRVLMSRPVGPDHELALSPTEDH